MWPIRKKFVLLHPISKEREQRRANFNRRFQKNASNVERTLIEDFEREIVLMDNQMPHSSSGPGHLPLTQKIISSTLICGTKPLQSERLFCFSLLWYGKNFVSLHRELWDAISYIWPITVRITMVGRRSRGCRRCSRRWSRHWRHSSASLSPWWAAAVRTQGCMPAISMRTLKLMMNVE